MKFGKDKKGERKNAKHQPQIVKKETERVSTVHQSDRSTKKMAQSADKSIKGGKKLQLCSKGSTRSRDERLIFDKMELARNFYWCDELDFYKMRSPVREIIAFCNHSYTLEDALPDVFNFLPRLKSAQKHAKRYLEYRAAFRFRNEQTP